VISAYAPRSARVDRLASQLAYRQHKNRSNALRSAAEKLIVRDENEPISYGQDVRKTYPLADFFINTHSNSEIKDCIQRFVELIFGNQWPTPSRDEQGMMFAYVAALRSASPARQVGAALTDSAGLLVSTGTNEVPKTGGGQYWAGDPNDGRDFVYDAEDTSDKMRMNLLTDVLTRIKDLSYLKDGAPSLPKMLKPGSKSFASLREAQLFDTIDFIRAVHAEMSALLTAKSSLVQAYLYVTTFPCHECARHIVAAGVKRVVYIEPYPKSLVSELFRDSIEIDPETESDVKVSFVPFTGVAPSMYIHFFRASERAKRKSDDGVINKWSPTSANPHVSPAYSIEAKRHAETAMLKQFITELVAKGIKNAPRRRRSNRRKRVA
jgi:cytidine deaminase